MREPTPVRTTTPDTHSSPKETLMKFWQPTTLALALAACFPSIASAQSNEELLKEIRALRDKVNALEAKQKAMETKGDSGQWGMTPAQQADLNRLTVKTESLEDSREENGFTGLKVMARCRCPTSTTSPAPAGFQFLDAVWQDGYNTPTATSASRCSTSRRRCRTAPGGG
jgi:hypothetical protein